MITTIINKLTKRYTVLAYIPICIVTASCVIGFIGVAVESNYLAGIGLGGMLAIGFIGLFKKPETE